MTYDAPVHLLLFDDIRRGMSFSKPQYHVNQHLLKTHYVEKSHVMVPPCCIVKLGLCRIRSRNRSREEVARSQRPLSRLKRPGTLLTTTGYVWLIYNIYIYILFIHRCCLLTTDKYCKLICVWLPKFKHLATLIDHCSLPNFMNPN